MKYIVEVRQGDWRRVRFVEPMDDIDDANQLVGRLTKWNFGLFRVTEIGI